MLSFEVSQLEQHRVALRGHCYRMLGSALDADDAVQDAIVRAWRNIEHFDGRASLKTWLYRIATNVCLDALADRKRVRPMEDTPEHTADGTLEARPRSHWLEPVPDAQVIPSDVDLSEQLVLRQSVRLAFVAALQHLPPKQRAALLLTEVLGWSAAEVAETLDTSVASINSALQRARATLAARNLGEARVSLSEMQLSLVDRYVAAFESYDVDALTSMLTKDAVLNMPPYTLWLRGHDSINTWLKGRGAGCRGSRLIRTSACGQPAFGQYRENGNLPWALLVLELEGGAITGMTSFLDVETLFPVFGLPARFPS
jgi:RNA polymerase sigma-70 factor (ECF subfamily)